MNILFRITNFRNMKFMVKGKEIRGKGKTPFCKKGFPFFSSSPIPFTLIELLVVIAVIAILAGMLLPALSAVRQTGRKALCFSNIKQLTMGYISYCDDSNGQLMDSINRTVAIQRLVRLMGGNDQYRTTPSENTYNKLCCPVPERYGGEIQTCDYPGYLGFLAGDLNLPWNHAVRQYVKAYSRTVLFVDGPTSFWGGQAWMGCTTGNATWYYFPGARGIDSTLPAFTGYGAGDAGANTDFLRGRHNFSINKSYWDGHVDNSPTRQAMSESKLLTRGNQLSYFP